MVFRYVVRPSALYNVIALTVSNCLEVSEV